MSSIKVLAKKLFIKINQEATPRARRYITKKISGALPPGHTLLRQIKFRVRVSPRKSFYMIHYGSHIEQQTFFYGPFNSWEQDMGWIWKQLCCCSEVIFDIGANTGIYSLTAKTLNKKAKVHAFEPSNHIYSRLLANSRLNKFDIVCQQMAVSNQSGSQILYDLPHASDNASLSPDKMKNWEGYIGEIVDYEVKTTTLSNYIKEYSITKLDLIKIDVELFEPEVIEGLGQYLLKFKPVIILEMLTADVAQKLGKQISLKEFRLFHLRNDMSAVELDEFKINTTDQNSMEWNYLLFHKNLSPKIKKNTTLLDGC